MKILCFLSLITCSFVGLTKQDLVDDFIITHSTINTWKIREKGIAIGNDLILRREIIDNFKWNWFNAKNYINNYPGEQSRDWICSFMALNSWTRLIVSRRLRIIEKKHKLLMDNKIFDYVNLRNGSIANIITVGVSGNGMATREIASSLQNYTRGAKDVLSTFTRDLKVANMFMKKLQYVTEKFTKSTRKLQGGTQQGKNDSQLILSLIVIENQLNFYSDEIDALKALVDETNQIFLSTTSHLTHDLMSEDELKQTTKEINNMLGRKGKQLGIDLQTAYIPGVVPVSKTRDMHNIDLFVYFPILDVNERIPNYMDQVSQITNEQNDQKKMFSTTPLETKKIMIEIVFAITLCIAIYCLKRNQNSLEEKFLKAVQPEHQNPTNFNQNEIQTVELLYSAAQSFHFAEKQKNDAVKSEKRIQKKTLFTLLQKTLICPSHTFKPENDSNQIAINLD